MISKKIFRNFRQLVTVLAFALIVVSAQAFGQGAPIYDNIPNPLPGNMPSQPFEAQQVNEFGDRVAFSTGSGRHLTTVTVTMSSWGCQSGHWTGSAIYGGVCVTTPGSTFSHPITLKIYNVGALFAPGSLIGAATQTFNIPYRPSADTTNCTGSNAGKWYDAGSSTCFNGFATNITFDLTSQNLLLTDEVIFGIAYNTSHYGYLPIGTSLCSATSAGCGYDSLNVALADPATFNLVGDNPSPDDAYFNSSYSGSYCDGGAGGLNVFRLDPGAGCWTGYKPAVRFNASNPATTQTDCKNGGWRSHTTSAGAPFPNQGQCMQYINNGH